MLGYLVLSTDTQLYREYSRDSSVPLVARPFLAFSTHVFQRLYLWCDLQRCELALMVIKFCELTEPKEINR